MVFQTEHLATIAPHSLAHTITVQPPVIINADFGVFFVVEGAVDIDLERHGTLRL